MNILFIFLRERIREKDLRPTDRIHLVEPENPNDFLTRTSTHLESGLHKDYTRQRGITVA